MDDGGNFDGRSMRGVALLYGVARWLSFRLSSCGEGVICDGKEMMRKNVVGVIDCHPGMLDNRNSLRTCFESLLFVDVYLFFFFM